MKNLKDKIERKYYYLKYYQGFCSDKLINLSADDFIKLIKTGFIIFKFDENIDHCQMITFNEHSSFFILIKKNSQIAQLV